MTGLHILIPLHDFNQGGTEIIAFRLARRWMDMGCRVSVVAGASDGAAWPPEGAGVHVIDPQVPRSALSRLGLGKAMVPTVRALRPDLIFIPGNFHFILAHALKRELPGVPIVAKISNPLVPSVGIGNLFAEAIAPLLRPYLRPIDMLVAMSRGLEADCRRVAPQAPLTTILDPNIADDLAAHPMRDRRGASSPIDLLAIGRLEPQKDFALALRTLAELRKQVDAQLTIAGEGRDRARLETEARRLGIAGAVAMPGFVSGIGELFDKASVLLVTSRYEGGPATALEALAHGVPVVGTDCSHLLREVLASERIGRLVRRRDPRALADAVLAQVTTPPASPDELAAAIAPSRTSAAAQAYLDLFEQLTAPRGQASRSA